MFETAAERLVVAVSAGPPGKRALRNFEMTPTRSDSTWTVHARGFWRHGVVMDRAAAAPPELVAARPANEHYAFSAAQRGLEYGPAFQGIVQLQQVRRPRCHGPPGPARRGLTGDWSYAASLRCSMRPRSSAALIEDGAPDDTFVPVRIEAVAAVRRGTLTAAGTATPAAAATQSSTVIVDVDVHGDDGHLPMQVTGPVLSDRRRAHCERSIFSTCPRMAERDDGARIIAKGPHRWRCEGGPPGTTARLYRVGRCLTC